VFNQFGDLERCEHRPGTFGVAKAVGRRVACLSDGRVGRPSGERRVKRLAVQRLRRLQHRDRRQASQMTAGHSAASLRAALLVLALIPKNALGQNVYGPSGLLQTGPQSAEDAP